MATLLWGRFFRFLLDMFLNRKTKRRIARRLTPIYGCLNPGFWLGIGLVPREQALDRVKDTVFDALVMNFARYLLGLGMEEVLVGRR